MVLISSINNFQQWANLVSSSSILFVPNMVCLKFWKISNLQKTWKTMTDTMSIDILFMNCLHFITILSLYMHTFLNWRIIALQNFVLFCQTSTWISHRYIYIPSLLNLPPISLPIPLLYFKVSCRSHDFLQHISSNTKGYYVLLKLIIDIII